MGGASGDTGNDALVCCQPKGSDGSMIMFSRRMAADGEENVGSGSKGGGGTGLLQIQRRPMGMSGVQLLLGSAACGLKQKAICLSSQEVGMLAVWGVVMVTLWCLNSPEFCLFCSAALSSPPGHLSVQHGARGSASSLWPCSQEEAGSPAKLGCHGGCEVSPFLWLLCSPKCNRGCVPKQKRENGYEAASWRSS